MPRSEDNAQNGEPIDIDALMLDIRQRVADKKRRGMYSVDALAEDAMDETEPVGIDDLERIRGLAVQHVDLQASASEKGGVAGAALTTVKRRLVRGVSQPLYSMAAQASAYNAAVVGYLSRLGREVAALGSSVESLRADVERTSGRLDETTRQVAAAHDELARVRAQLGEVRASALADRVARLEREDRAPIAAPAVDTEGEGGSPPPATILGTIVSGRDLTAELLDARAEVVAGAARPLLHVGAGAGTLLAKVPGPAQGVEADPELAASGVRDGHAITCAHPSRFVASLAGGSVGSALVTDVVERIDGDALMALLLGLGSAIRPGGPVAIEALDPRADDAELWRDPRQLRPLHPEGLVAACRAAGFSDLSIDALTGEGIGHRYLVRGRA